jgi:SAM-dependent methyltransferase
MIYRSNIQAPDLQPHFAATTICKPRPWSMGHDVLSDAVYEPECGFMTHDEAAILYECAWRSREGFWIDIGARTGWTTAHIAAAGAQVAAVDPMLIYAEFLSRFERDVQEFWSNIAGLYAADSDYFFDVHEEYKGVCSGVCIDGNHDAPCPLNDARNALTFLADTGVIALHDFYGLPIRDAVRYLIGEGMKCRVYNTPNGMAVCWRGNFTPPDHVPDPSIDWAAVRANRAPEFDFGVCK